MNLQKLNPWNWFKHEDNNQTTQIPVHRDRAARNNPLLWQQGQHPILQLHQQVDRLFDDVLNGFGIPSLSLSSAQQVTGDNKLVNYRPQIDVSGDDKPYEITLDVPGRSGDDLAIELKGDLLIINGKKEEKNEHKNKQFYRIERIYGAFQRTLSLPEDANTEDIQAHIKNAVLSLTTQLS